MKVDAIVVGGGMAGLTSAAYLARAGRSVILFEKEAKTGGLVNSFEKNGYVFDGGIRAIENSGIILPMLRQLGIDVDLIESNVSVGMEKEVITLRDKGSLREYEDFLKRHFRENQKDITDIIREIRKIMGYMDVLYGIDNPAFLDLKHDPGYVMKTLLPWLVKYLFTVGKIMRLDMPVETYIKKFTCDRKLIDIIAQHFFQKTPAFFALSYFSLYLDYRYPRGGTGKLSESLEAYCRSRGVNIMTGTRITALDPEGRSVTDHRGNAYTYGDLVWAANLKDLYDNIPEERIGKKKIRNAVRGKRREIRGLRGGDSVFTLYLCVNRDKKYFSDICSGHFFYTPHKDGLSTVDVSDVGKYLNDPGSFEEPRARQMIRAYLDEYFRLNTFEISFPVLRDDSLAPEGKTGIIVSTLFDHRLTERIAEAGWYQAFKAHAEDAIISVLENSIFPGLSADIEDRFSSTPLSIEARTANMHGAITGWAFTNPRIPVTHKLTRMFSSTETPLPHIHQAGQWSYSPAGLPISVLTGKLAADKILK